MGYTRRSQNSMSLLNHIAASTHFSTDVWASYRKRMRQRKKRKLFPFHLPYVCIFFLLKNIFYVTVNKWDVAESFLTSRQLMCKLKFTIIGVHIGFFFFTASAADVCHSAHLNKSVMDFTSNQKREENVLSNDSGPRRNAGNSFLMQ